MTEVASRPTTNGTHASTGPATKSVGDSHGLAYSVPSQAESLFRHGVLNNPLLSKEMPADYEKYASTISFTGSSKPAIPINWRFAESVSSLKALEGMYINALLDKKYGVAPQKIVVNTDHSQLYFMSALLWVLQPNSSKPISFRSLSSGDEEARNKFHKWFPNTDIYGGTKATPYRRAATNIYKTKDNRCFHLHGSLNPTPTIESIGLPQNQDAKDHDEAVRPYIEKLAEINSDDMQERASDKYKQAGTICWTIDEFKNSEHGRANEHVGLFEIHKQAGSNQKPSWWPESAQTGPNRPLAGLKVVDLTRIIAAPAVSRGLAELGASVMRVTAPHLPDFHSLHPDLNWGKWNCSVDLRKEEDRVALKDLILDADVVLSGYRPGVMEKYGFGPNDIFEMCKGRDRGIIVARENCYGWNGPWAYRSGWQQISDANTGVSIEFGRAMGNDEAVTPVFPNSDYCTGIAGACGITQAILRRGENGGSYLVDIALNYYSHWLVNSCGTYPPNVWNDLWSSYSSPVFRHYHNMDYTVPAFLKMLQTPGARGNAIFAPENFEDRVVKNLWDAEADTEVVMRKPKSILKFPEGGVQLGFNVGTRGNGADKARWPKDLMVQNVE